MMAFVLGIVTNFDSDSVLLFISDHHHQTLWSSHSRKHFDHQMDPGHRSLECGHWHQMVWTAFAACLQSSHQSHLGPCYQEEARAHSMYQMGGLFHRDIQIDNCPDQKSPNYKGFNENAYAIILKPNLEGTKGEIRKHTKLLQTFIWL